MSKIFNQRILFAPETKVTTLPARTTSHELYPQTTMAHKTLTTRHVNSINDLTNREIETVFKVADYYLNKLPDARYTYRIGRSTDVASNCILATLFYEPSTRTRLSFESAMLRLGGNTITSSDPTTSSAAKGESLADSVRVIANYADAIVIRHPRDGAARLAADYSPIPIINGGDGSHEHPTQTLCDLFTLKRENKHLNKLTVAISGDLKGSRTIHSFVYALARFGANIAPQPAKGMELPAHVYRRLREEFNVKMDPMPGAVDALYQTSEEPHQPSFFPTVDKIHALYVTRFQKERWKDKEHQYPRIDKKFLSDPKYSDTSILHPLPRVGELDAALDSDTRAVYFQQAAYGVPVRMALISLLLGLFKDENFRQFEGGFEKSKYPCYDQPLSTGLQCPNDNCIVHEEMEKQYVRNRFYVIPPRNQIERNAHSKLRCVYCETDIDDFVLASQKHKWYTDDISSLSTRWKQGFADLIAFGSPEAAEQHGYHSKNLGRTPASD